MCPRPPLYLYPQTPLPSVCLDRPFSPARLAHSCDTAVRQVPPSPHPAQLVQRRPRETVGPFSHGAPSMQHRTSSLLHGPSSDKRTPPPSPPPRHFHRSGGVGETAPDAWHVTVRVGRPSGLDTAAPHARCASPHVSRPQRARPNLQLSRRTTPYGVKMHRIDEGLNGGTAPHEAHCHADKQVACCPSCEKRWCCSYRRPAPFPRLASSRYQPCNRPPVQVVPPISLTPTRPTARPAPRAHMRAHQLALSRRACARSPPRQPPTCPTPVSAAPSCRRATPRGARHHTGAHPQ